MVLKFFKKSFLFLLPLLIVIACYFWTDPFKNLYQYKYYTSTYVMLPRGNVSTKVYMKNYDKYKYNSFIFGSSRSCASTSKEWANYLPKGSVPYSFSAWAEKIDGIYKRIKLIDSLKRPLNNAFLVFDYNLTFMEPEQDLLTDHYLISKSSILDYYTNDFLTYLKDPILIFTSVDYTLFHKRRSYMTDDRFVGIKESDIDPINNDWEVNSEFKFKRDSAKFWDLIINKNIDVVINEKLHPRSAIQIESSKEISVRQEKLLKAIFNIFKKHKTNYKIIISPLYNQVKFNHNDLQIIRKIFKAENVFDYSGINSITNNKYYYMADGVHYRKAVGNRIFKDIYKGH